MMRLNFLLAGLILNSAFLYSQVITNKYSMVLKPNTAGGYYLADSAKIAKVIDLAAFPDMFVPYTYIPDRL